MTKEYYVYIIECCSGRLYTGYTVDIEKRFNEHVSGKKGAKFTKAFKPGKVAASWRINGTRGDALRVEAFIKSLARKEKIIITAKPESLGDRLISEKEIKCDITVYNYEASNIQ